MFKTTVEGLVTHLQEDMKVAKNSIVWLHSGLLGLGVVEGGVDTITKAFSIVLPEGALVVPSFTYSWCNNSIYGASSTECPDMGGYAKEAWKDKRFARNHNPNFSVSVMDQTPDQRVKKALFLDDTRRTCFGSGSVFDQMYNLSKKMPGRIVLLGGAHNDVVFRSTFVHFIEEKVGVPYRYHKVFEDPLNSGESVDQLVRFMSKSDCEKVNKEGCDDYSFPVKEKYRKLGDDLVGSGLFDCSSFGYSLTRSVPMLEFCNWLEGKIKQDPKYLLK